jgi:hypothetical protein
MGPPEPKGERALSELVSGLADLYEAWRELQRSGRAEADWWGAGYPVCCAGWRRRGTTSLGLEDDPGRALVLFVRDPMEAALLHLAVGSAGGEIDLEAEAIVVKDHGRGAGDRAAFLVTFSLLAVAS